MAKRRNDNRSTNAGSGGANNTNATTASNNDTQEQNDMSNTSNDNGGSGFSSANNTNNATASETSFGGSGAVAAPFGATQTGEFGTDFSASSEINTTDDLSGAEEDINNFSSENPLGLSDEATLAASNLSDETTFTPADISEDYLEEEGEFTDSMGSGDENIFNDGVDDVIVIVEETVVPVPYPVYTKPQPKTLAHRAGQVGGAVLAIVKENPVPAALTTLGLFSLVRGVRGGHNTTITVRDLNGGSTAGNGYAARRASRPAPTSVVGGVTGAVTDVASSAASSLVDLAKANPVPASAAALSLFWLVQSQRKGGDGLDKVAMAAGKVVDAAGAVGDKVEAMADAAKAKAGDLFDHTKDAASNLTETVSDKASGATQTVVGGAGDAAHTVAEKASGAAHSIAEKATGAAKTVAQTATSAAHTVAGTTTETAGTLARLLAGNPLALALAAFSVGIGLGFLLPETEAENKLMGDTADRISDAIADKARQTARDLTGKVEEVATTFSDQVLSNGS